MDAKKLQQHIKNLAKQDSPAQSVMMSMLYQAGSLALDLEAQRDALLEACESINGFIGNVDHSTGHGENAARMRGNMLMGIKKIIEAAIAKTKQKAINNIGL